jgi:hypothetical protein
VEWETTGASAAGSTTGSSAPLTYEQIMAQIAQYPGPDEPLYVPAEGEQIWLTDLEGHKDIYDNDSIKVNYAPGFDKSQITRIDVYRNGVKMRFLPALFDVLTNAQIRCSMGTRPRTRRQATTRTMRSLGTCTGSNSMPRPQRLLLLSRQRFARRSRTGRRISMPT